MSAILLGKFERGDVVAWLREFDACADANGWKTEDKIKKLPAFLKGQASHFYSIAAEDRESYATASKALKAAMYPQASRENYFAEFESIILRPAWRRSIRIQMAHLVAIDLAKKQQDLEEKLSLNQRESYSGEANDFTGGPILLYLR